MRVLARVATASRFGSRRISCRYQELVSSDQLRYDEAQASTAELLTALLPSNQAAGSATRKGAYIWGPVGSGKSLLMDLYGEECAKQLGPEKTRRVHFHQFMHEIHQSLHQLQLAQPKVEKESPMGLRTFALAEPNSVPEEPVHLVADCIAKNTKLLCLDEMQVSDVADAMIVRQLFERLWERGVQCVMTSNRDVGQLYEGGLNRVYFVPFIDLVRQQCDVVLVSGGTDYRYHGLPNGLRKGGGGRYFTGPAARKELQQLWHSSDGSEIAQLKLPFGRHVKCSKLGAADSHWGEAARFDFQQLCGTGQSDQSYGAADFIAISEHLDTLFLDDIPELGAKQRNEARRLITLIDTLYEAETKLVAFGVCDPENLFDAFLTAPDEYVAGAEIALSDSDTQVGSDWSALGSDDKLKGSELNKVQKIVGVFTAREERFMFRRAISRLREMTGISIPSS